MKTAKDYLIFPLDVPAPDQAREYVVRLADCVGMFKVGLELFIAAGPEIIQQIKTTSDAQVFLDLKLHDIPATVQRAMQRIAGLGVALTTIHCAGAQKMMAAAVKGSAGRVGVLGVTVLTSMNADDLRSAGFKDQFVADLQSLVVKRAAMAQSAGCSGVVCSGQEVQTLRGMLGQDFLMVTPGIRPAWDVASEDDQQRVVTPAQAIANGADHLVIGRPIRDARNPREAALRVIAEIEAVL